MILVEYNVALLLLLGHKTLHYKLTAKGIVHQDHTTMSTAENVWKLLQAPTYLSPWQNGYKVNSKTVQKGKSDDQDPIPPLQHRW